MIEQPRILRVVEFKNFRTTSQFSQLRPICLNMPFSPQKHADLLASIDAALSSGSFNDWERNFLGDMRQKLERYGPRTRLTDKQYSRLMHMVEQQLAAGPDIGPMNGGRVRKFRPRKRIHTMAPRIGPTLGTVLIVLVIGAFAVFHLAERFPERFSLLVSMTSLEQVQGPVTRVRDGDTIEVARVPIRFGSLDCAERDTAEGMRATARMRDLVNGQNLRCYLNGRSSYDRMIGSCRLDDGRDLAGIMIKEGYCSRFW